MIILKSSDDIEYKINVIKIFEICGLVKEIIEDVENDEDIEINLIKVDGNILKIIIEFLEYYSLNEEMKTITNPLQSYKIEELVQKWYCDFLIKYKSYYIEILNAADYMHIDPLINLICIKIAINLQGKTSEEIRKELDIDTNDDEEAFLNNELHCNN